MVLRNYLVIPVFILKKKKKKELESDKKEEFDYIIFE